MLIRSQDKNFIVNMDNVVIQTMRKEVVCYAISDIEGNSYISLGYYSTEDKPLKVADMIQEAYASCKAIQCASNGLSAIAATYNPLYAASGIDKGLKALEEYTNVIKDGFVFQMPADNEVEV